MILYHATSLHRAAMIRARGFRGRLAGEAVWLADRPLTAFGEAVLEVELAVPEAELAPYEQVGESKGFREWALPAELINARGTTRLRLEDPMGSRHMPTRTDPCPSCRAPLCATNHAPGGYSIAWPDAVRTTPGGEALVCPNCEAPSGPRDGGPRSICRRCAALTRRLVCPTCRLTPVTLQPGQGPPPEHQRAQ